MYGHLLVMAVVNIVIPFTLISYGEQSIDSAMAAILNATVPLAVIVIAPMFLPDERIMTVARVAGLAIGFRRRPCCSSRRPRQPRRSATRGASCLVLGRASVRRRQRLRRRNVRGLAPMIPALFQVAFAAMIVIPIALVVDRPFSTVTPTPEAIVGGPVAPAARLGLAYLCYFTILRAWGATRTSTVGVPAAGRRDRPRRRRPRRPDHRRLDRRHPPGDRGHRDRQQRSGPAAPRDVAGSGRRRASARLRVALRAPARERQPAGDRPGDSEQRRDPEQRLGALAAYTRPPTTFAVKPPGRRWSSRSAPGPTPGGATAAAAGSPSRSRSRAPRSGPRDQPRRDDRGRRGEHGPQQERDRVQQ